MDAYIFFSMGNPQLESNPRQWSCQLNNKEDCKSIMSVLLSNSVVHVKHTAIFSIIIFSIFFRRSADTVYFHLPPLSVEMKCVYGVSCYRQIDAKVGPTALPHNIHIHLSVCTSYSSFDLILHILTD